MRRSDNVNAEDSEGRKESSLAHRSGSTTQTPMTLDQYYYPTLINTDSRDKDQVLSKYLAWKAEETKPKHREGQSSATGMTSSLRDRVKKGDSESVLTVNQIWIWIIDESMGSANSIIQSG